MEENEPLKLPVHKVEEEKPPGTAEFQPLRVRSLRHARQRLGVVLGLV
jgi:hypothetical protein